MLGRCSHCDRLVLEANDPRGLCKECTDKLQPGTIELFLILDQAVPYLFCVAGCFLYSLNH